MSISILGMGSWGSSLAIGLSHIGAVILWGRDENLAKQVELSRTNPNYLPDSVKLPLNICVTTSWEEIFKSKLLVIATPLSVFRDMLERLKDVIQDKEIDVIWLCKGFEINSGLLPHQIALEVCGFNYTTQHTGALLGPSFADEVALGLPTAFAIVSNNSNFTMEWVTRFNNVPNFRVYAQDDIVGAEVGAGVKNVIAIAAGISDGLHLGFNARAALITRGLHESQALSIKLGGRAETMYGLTGMGDMILTCTSDLSRNRNVGLQLAKGYKISEIIANLGHVTEGVYAVRAVHDLALRFNLNLPIVNAVYEIIYGDANLSDIVATLLKREPKLEFGA